MKRKDGKEPGKRIVKRAGAVPARPRKATQEQAREIVLEVMGMLSDLTDRECIVQHCAKKYGLHSRQADTYIARARAMLRECVVGEVQDRRAAAVHRLCLFLEQVRLSGRERFALELQIHREINKLLIPAQWEAVELSERGPRQVDTRILDDYLAIPEQRARFRELFFEREAVTPDGLREAVALTRVELSREKLREAVQILQKAEQGE